MKKFLLCLLLIGLTAGATVAITKNWDTIEGWFTPAQEETVETPEDETPKEDVNTDGENQTPTDNEDTTEDENQTPEDNTPNDDVENENTPAEAVPVVSIISGGVTFNVNC